MDSQQLINALHEAQLQAGKQPCRVVITTRKAKRALECHGAILVSYDPAPRSASIGEHYKPTITITSITHP